MGLALWVWVGAGGLISSIIIFMARSGSGVTCRLRERERWP